MKKLGSHVWRDIQASDGLATVWEQGSKMRAPMRARLAAVVAGAVLWWGGLAAPACALGHMVIFRDPVLYKRYAAMEGRFTKLQIQNQAELYSAQWKGRRVALRGVVQEVLPPELGQDPDICKVIVELRGVAGFTTPELPVLNYVVPKSRALALKLRSPIALSGKLYAIDRYGAVAIELDAPTGWSSEADDLGEAGEAGPKKLN